MSRFLYFLFVFVLIACETPPPNEAVHLVPKPSQLLMGAGQFQIQESTIILFNLEAEPETEYLQDYLSTAVGIELTSEKKKDGNPKSNSIYLNIIKGDTSNEAYSLEVTEDFIWITSESRAGVFYGIQSLMQIMDAADSDISIPALMLEDHPHFEHRGMLLDCCRHFMTKDFVKRYIDLLAYHKMNVLHWHLTEDQGWRIEIDAYPELTNTGAWRIEEDGSRYGGFYTKDEIREVVAYAESRHVTIIPEIEMPGHSTAAIAAYPHLSCTGEQIEVENEWGVFKDIYCAGNDSVFNFLETVLLEVIELFPSEYIHIGGDEAPKYRWEQCEKCQNRIVTMGLNDEHELQSWFISRMEEFINERGKKLIGWDEILEGGLAENAIVQSWRGMEGGFHAAQTGHYAIMSPTSHCYFDYGLEATDLEEVYSFDPIPVGLTPEQELMILGGECNMWTERAPQETIDSKVFPRILAMSEVLWTYPEERDFEEFRDRLLTHYSRLDKMEVAYGFETVPVDFSLDIIEDHLVLSAVSNVDDAQLTYALIDESGERIGEFLPYYEGLRVEGNGSFQFMSTWKGREFPKPIESQVAFHAGLTGSLNVLSGYSDSYTGGGDQSLVDGYLGTMDFRDGHWQAVQGNDMEIICDLGSTTEISTVQTNFYQYNNAWIFLPDTVFFEMSDDGEAWSPMGYITHTEPMEEEAQFIYTFALGFEPVELRYVKMKASSIGPNPEWHDSPGQDSWLFCDELILR